MNRYIVGICIPTLNASSLLPRALKSLEHIARKYPLLVVLSDGGSTDNTVSIFRSYFQSTSRHIYSHVIVEPGSSHSRSILLGIDFLLKSNCILINWLNADDALTSNSSALVDYATSEDLNKAVVYYGFSTLIKPSGAVVQLHPPASITFSSMAASGKPLISQPACLITRHALTKAGSVNCDQWNYAIDHELWLRLLLNGVSFIYCNIHVCEERRSYSGKSQLPITSIIKQKLILEYSQFMRDPVDLSVAHVNSYIQAFCYAADSACIGAALLYLLGSISSIIRGVRLTSSLYRFFPPDKYNQFSRDIAWGTYYLVSSILRSCR